MKNEKMVIQYPKMKIIGEWPFTKLGEALDPLLEKRDIPLTCRDVCLDGEYEDPIIILSRYYGFFGTERAHNESPDEVDITNVAGVKYYVTCSPQFGPREILWYSLHNEPIAPYVEPELTLKRISESLNNGTENVSIRARSNPKVELVIFKDFDCEGFYVYIGKDKVGKFPKDMLRTISEGTGIDFKGERTDVLDLYSKDNSCDFEEALNIIKMSLDYAKNSGS